MTDRLTQYNPGPGTTARLRDIAPTLANYPPLDCGIVRIGERWHVFYAGSFHDRPLASRIEAIRALARLDADAHGAETRG